MSSSTLFQSMLLSKPRVENFHGSRIKSAKFTVSSRFSGVKFNASACSNPKVKSFMCCSVKVENFVNSTACSLTSKIANFGKAKENYFEKVLIDRILKAVKWLKIPAVVVLLLTIMMSAHRVNPALAASSGVIGDHRSISSSSYESSIGQHESSINGKHESSSGVVYVIIFVSAMLVYFLRNESTRGQTKVIKFEVGLRLPISDFVGIHKKEDEFAEDIKPSKTKSSYSMRTYPLRGTAGKLCYKYMPFINKSYLSVKRCNSIEEAETYYLKLSNEEQKKYDHLNEITRKYNREKTISNRRGLFNNTEWTNIVVTILVAARGEEVDGFPNNIGSKRSLYNALQSFVRMSLPRFAEIQALNIFWTPLIENYGLTDMEVRIAYPYLHEIRGWGIADFIDFMLN